MQASQAEKNIFGGDVKLHPITRMPLEQGIGCLPPDVQAENVHLPEIERMHGRAAAENMRRKLNDANTIKEAQADMAKE
jgi:hypothetical protein